MARNSYGIAKRSIWYVLRTLIGVFIEGLHISNLYILVTEGMEKRAEAILKYGQTGVDIDLTPYFSEEYLNNDHELDSGKYADFTVASYDYRIDVKAVSVLPWSKRANMTVDARLAAINAASDDTEGAAGMGSRAIPGGVQARRIPLVHKQHNPSSARPRNRSQAHA